MHSTNGQGHSLVCSFVLIRTLDKFRLWRLYFGETDLRFVRSFEHRSNMEEEKRSRED